MELIPTQCAVIAIHMQGDVVARDGAFAPLFHEQVVARGVVAAVGGLMDAARTSGARTIFTRVAWKPDYSDLDANSSLLQFVVQTGALKEGRPLTDVVAELDPQPEDLIHTHRRIGGFTTELDRLLRTAGVTTVIFCGVATNASVEGSARQASDAGYRVVIVDDACSAASLDTHRASIKSMGLIGEVADSQTILDQFARVGTAAG